MSDTGKLIARLRAVIDTALLDSSAASSEFDCTAEDYAETERHRRELGMVRDELIDVLEKVTAERDEAREAAENNVLNAEATYERMDEKLRKVTAERDFFASELSVAEHTSALRYYRAEKAEAERDNAEKQVQIRAEDSIAARVARQNVRAVEEYARLVTERDQLAAVVEQVRQWRHDWFNEPIEGVKRKPHHRRLDDALNAAPSVALDRVRAEALREAADEVEKLYFGDGSTGSANRWGAKTAAKRLRERADRIEKGESNE